MVEEPQPAAAPAPATGEKTADKPADKSADKGTDKAPLGPAKVQSLLDAKRFTEALAELEFLLKNDSKNPVLLKQKGFALRELGKLSEAVTAYIDALKIKPDLHEAKEYLAVTYLRMGEIKPLRQLHKELKAEAADLARMLEAEAKKRGVKL
jgi:tetratricopeptide (TPR) repeat protein